MQIYLSRYEDLLNSENSRYFFQRKSLLLNFPLSVYVSLFFYKLTYTRLKYKVGHINKWLCGANTCLKEENLEIRPEEAYDE